MGTTRDLDAADGNVYYLGYFTDEVALNAAHPIGVAGEYAIVGSTETIWIWNTSTSTWTDSSIASSSDVRVYLLDGVIYLQTKIGGVWTNTGTQWDV